MTKPMFHPEGMEYLGPATEWEKGLEEEITEDVKEWIWNMRKFTNKIPQRGWEHEQDVDNHGKTIRGQGSGGGPQSFR
jgi:hypothetical protein